MTLTHKPSVHPPLRGEQWAEALLSMSIKNTKGLQAAYGQTRPIIQIDSPHAFETGRVLLDSIPGSGFPIMNAYYLISACLFYWCMFKPEVSVFTYNNCYALYHSIIFFPTIVKKPDTLLSLSLFDHVSQWQSRAENEFNGNFIF